MVINVIEITINIICSLGNSIFGGAENKHHCDLIKSFFTIFELNFIILASTGAPDYDK